MVIGCLCMNYLELLRCLGLKVWWYCLSWSQVVVLLFYQLFLWQSAAQRYICILSSHELWSRTVYVLLTILTTVGPLTAITTCIGNTTTSLPWLICIKDHVLAAPWYPSFYFCYYHYMGTQMDHFVLMCLVLNNDLFAIKQRLVWWFLTLNPEPIN